MLKSPNQSSLTNAGITAVAFVAGAKVGDGIAAIMPESIAPFKRWGLAAAGIVLAASISGTTTTAKAAQSAALGMAAKQLSDEVSDNLIKAMPKKVDGAITSKFINAVVGHGLGSPDYYLGSSYDEGFDSIMWDRPVDEIPAAFDASAMM